MMTLRKLRVWHWKRCMSLRTSQYAFQHQADKYARDYPGRYSSSLLSKVARVRNQADFHIGCVIALNDAVLVEFAGGEQWCTAEHDALDARFK